uniref:Centromere/kinetochore protein putative n=1 Tax=Albugo laibachii Nc14 TaxID=890382 RepID=F0W1Z4_9STRA|nr:centromere/kinetochore protein putative [Albugo laibachii Nc14]|eukprot:CCA15073.1 centromere/kinetochore protein putative [Albugo laibachii Nc14]
MSAIEDLTQKLENTYTEIARIKSDVTSSLTSFYTNSSSISIEEAIKLASKYQEITQNKPDGETHSALSQLSIQLRQVMTQLQFDYPGKSAEKELSTPSVHAKCVLSYTESQRVKRQIETSEQMLLLIEKIISIDSQLRQIDALLGEDELVKASNLVKNAEAMLTMLKDAERSEVVGKGSTSYILKVMEMQWLKKKTRVETHIYRLFDELVQWEGDSVRILSSLANLDDELTIDASGRKRILSTELWSAAEVMGIQISTLEDLVEQTVEKIIQPSLQTSTPKKLHFQHEKEFSRVALHDLQKGTSETQSSDPKSNKASTFHRKILLIADVLVEFFRQLFTEKSTLSGQWMELMWKEPGNLEKILLDYFVEQLPADKSVLASLASQFRDLMSEFVDKLSIGDLHLSIPSQLLNFADHIYHFHAKKRVHSILSLGRDYMRRNYCDSIKITGATERCSLFNTEHVGKCGTGKGLNKGCQNGVPDLSTQESDDDFGQTYFQMPDYRISTCVHDLLELAHQTLIEACESDEHSAEVLLSAVRDLFFLFRMMIPALYVDTITNDGRICMLYHNDCMYITYHMLSIGFHYAKRFPSSIQSKTTMIDLVPIFRRSAEETLSQFTLSVRKELLSKLQSLPLPSQMSSLDQYEDYVKMVNYKISNLSSPWKEGLPGVLYQRMIGLMVEPLLCAFMDRIVTKEVISVSRSPQLHHILSLLLECVNAYDSTAQAIKYLPTIVQLQDVTLILKEPIASVQDMVNAGKIAAYNRKKVAILVRALIPRGSRQDDLLKRLEDDRAHGTATE